MLFDFDGMVSQQAEQGLKKITYSKEIGQG